MINDRMCRTKLLKNPCMKDGEARRRVYMLFVRLHRFSSQWPTPPIHTYARPITSGVYEPLEFEPWKKTGRVSQLNRGGCGVLRPSGAMEALHN